MDLDADRLGPGEQPVSQAAPAPETSWRGVNVVLIGLALLLVASTIFFGVRTLRADPAEAKADALSRQYSALSKAATTETEAFLTVNYEDMDPLIEKVLDGATGDFKKQYAGARENLKSSAVTAEAVSRGTVRKVGVADVAGKNAVVFIAADSQVANKSSQGKPQPRYYRLKLDMVKVGDSWLTSGLQFVG